MLYPLTPMSHSTFETIIDCNISLWQALALCISLFLERTKDVPDKEHGYKMHQDGNVVVLEITSWIEGLVF